VALVSAARLARAGRAVKFGCCHRVGRCAAVSHGRCRGFTRSPSAISRRFQMVCEWVLILEQCDRPAKVEAGSALGACAA